MTEFAYELCTIIMSMCVFRFVNAGLNLNELKGINQSISCIVNVKVQVVLVAVEYRRVQEDRMYSRNTSI